MVAGTGLTGYDLVVIIILGLLVLRGMWVGFLRQVSGLLALYAGYIVAGQYHDRVKPFLLEISKNPKVIFFASYALVFVATYIAVILAGRVAAFMMKLTFTGWLDKILGGVLGGAKAVLLLIMIHIVLKMALPPQDPMLTACQTCNALNKSTLFAQELIKDDDVRKMMAQKQTQFSTRDVKEFFETPPKEKAPAGLPPVQ
ncbi:MAG: CvpA family protein [Desulfocapsaceae bacterium]|nr:CvpA family protein [Desulfocapsaceae bacterium]